ncbi:MAG: hypothetical protein QOI36_966 [Pseudonocardiales bacterium]|jgi:hypothetical protein|nr:hypothetical protein [Pseudonocardiales bacterium]
MIRLGFNAAPWLTLISVHGTVHELSPFGAGHALFGAAGTGRA